MWCADGPLKLEAPRIYEISVEKDVKVANCNNSNERNSWNIPIRRNLNDWEIDEMTYLIGVVENQILRPEVEDAIWWIFSKNGEFSIKSCSHIFGNVDTPSQIWKKIWGLKIPSKIAFFAWATCKEKLPTMDFL